MSRPRLARFRVDPSKVQVAIRADGSKWLVTVTSRETGQQVESRGLHPRNVITKALRTAETVGFDGIDLGMEWTYKHPHGKGTRCGEDLH